MLIQFPSYQHDVFKQHSKTQKYFLFTMILNREKLQIFTFEKVEVLEHLAFLLDKCFRQLNQSISARKSITSVTYISTLVCTTATLHVHASHSGCRYSHVANVSSLIQTTLAEWLSAQDHNALMMIIRS